MYYKACSVSRHNFIVENTKYYKIFLKNYKEASRIVINQMSHELEVMVLINTADVHQ